MNKFAFGALALTALVFAACTSTGQSTSSTGIPASPSTTTAALPESLLTSTTSAFSSSQYTLADVAKHNSADDCWMVINGSVYDVTTYVPSHPGSEIVRGCGKDATSLFQGERKHQGFEAQSLLPTYKIGTVSQ